MSNSADSNPLSWYSGVLIFPYSPDSVLTFVNWLAISVTVITAFCGKFVTVIEWGYILTGIPS